MSEDLLENKLSEEMVFHKIVRGDHVVIPEEFRRFMAARNHGQVTWMIVGKRNGVCYIACFDTYGLKKSRYSMMNTYVECEIPDGRGRIQLQEWQRDLAKIKRQTVIAPSPDLQNFEIWNKNSFEKAYKPK